MAMKRSGTVYLVGAGPGDPGLITEKALRLLSRADVVLYDHLANPSLLLRAREGASLICVGKRGGRGGMSQAVINRRLVREARRGKTVVRLKGGDPILLGRGAEEALYLAKARIRFEVVPGVSAALAVPVCAGIPLTLRGMSSSVTILTGHEAEERSGPGVDWDRLLRADSTFVVLMGVRNLDMIVRRFLAAGKSPRLPSALVERGCTPLQRTIEAPLGRIASAARAQGVAPPAILVVGQIVALRRRMARQGRLPLKGITVLVTRPAGQAERMARLIEERGALPVLCPFIGIRPPRNLAPLDRAIAARSHYDWIIFTSANGVRAFMERLDSLGLDARALAGVKVCAVGPATAAELRDRGVRADCTPREFTTAGIVRALAARGVIEGGTFLLPRSDVAGVALPLALEKLGGRCRAVTAYRTIGLSKNARAAVGFIREMNVDVVSLTSPSAADVYAEALGGGSRERSPGPVIAAIGPVTAAAARARGLRVAIEPGTHTDKGLVRAIEAYVLHTRRRNRSSE